MEPLRILDAPDRRPDAPGHLAGCSMTRAGEARKAVARRSSFVPEARAKSDLLQGRTNLVEAAAFYGAHACVLVCGCDGPASSRRSPVVAAAGSAVRVPELSRAHVRAGMARRVCVLP